DVEGADTGRVLRLLDADLGADFPDVQVFAVPRGDLSGDEDDVPGLDAWDEVGNRLSGFGELDSELAEPVVDACHVGFMGGRLSGAAGARTLFLFRPWC